MRLQRTQWCFGTPETTRRLAWKYTQGHTSLVWRLAELDQLSVEWLEGPFDAPLRFAQGTHRGASALPHELGDYPLAVAHTILAGWRYRAPPVQEAEVHDELLREDWRRAVGPMVHRFRVQGIGGPLGGGEVQLSCMQNYREVKATLARLLHFCQLPHTTRIIFLTTVLSEENWPSAVFGDNTLPTQPPLEVEATIWMGW